MAAELTPMKRQYAQIKSEYSDCLLFFRLGDFYELFDDDAHTASRELDLTLTTRDRNKSEADQTPMCGVPYHSAESYIAKLIAKGYKVAICEQTEDPALAKGLVRREVIRVITPGTVTDESMLDDARSNYIAAIHSAGSTAAVCFSDVSTGEIFVFSYTDHASVHLINELGRLAPREVVLSAANDSLTDFLTQKLHAMLDIAPQLFQLEACTQAVCTQFGTDSLHTLGLDTPEQNPLLCAVGALLIYLKQTQKSDLSHIRHLEVYAGNRTMELDYATLKNLELTASLRTGEKKGSLLWVLDHSCTPLGARLLRSWVERPLCDPIPIQKRLTAVQTLVDDTVLRSELRRVLKKIGDLRRLISRCVYGTAGGRDLRALADHLLQLPALTSLLQTRTDLPQMLADIAHMDTLSDLADLASRAICDAPPFSIREGGILRDGYNEEVDRLRQVKDHGADMVQKLEARERERTGIKKLKVSYNKVFGYYIDIPRSQTDRPMPAEYIRKQTLVNNERFFTPELKDLETTLLGAGEKLCDLEYTLFCAVRQMFADQVARIQAAADQVAALDCLCALADVAVRQHYCRPDIDLSRQVRITGGRHPVVELAQSDVLFVPNDTYLDDASDRVAIITGPNMAGKSTYMRQTALIVLMAQMGSFVPADSASIGVVDRVFTRIGASDDLSGGQSTFMVEMVEMASILHYATRNSLLILDEIGRGTSTYDGMAIARAVLEFCADRRHLGAKTMFATHYHELAALEGQLPGLRNYNISAKKQGGKLLFLRRILPGAADDSYGIEVARLAGVPESVISRARTYLKEWEDRAKAASNAAEPPDTPPAASAHSDSQLSLTDLNALEIRDTLSKLDLNTLTPLEAMNLLYRMKMKLEGS